MISTLTSPYSSEGWLEKTTTSSCVAVLRCQTAGIGYSQVARAIRCLIGFVVGGCWVIPLRFPKVPQDLGILTVPYRTTPGTLGNTPELEPLKNPTSCFYSPSLAVFLFVFFCDGLARFFPCGSWRCVSFRKKNDETKPTAGKIPDSFLRQERSTPECMREKQFQKVYSPKFGGFNGGWVPWCNPNSVKTNHQLNKSKIMRDGMPRRPSTSSLLAPLSWFRRDSITH